MKAIIYWTIPDKTFDVIGDPDQFSTGSSSVLCHVGPGYVLSAYLSNGQYRVYVKVPENVVTQEVVRVLTFLPPVADGGASAVVALGDGRVMEVGLLNLRILSYGAS